jgi:hypothetical protein
MEEKIKELSDSDLLQLYRLLLEYLDVINAEKTTEAGDKK